ncbi:MAG: type 2 isopentenyl-diphosphate Delta-isomerase [Thermoplasmataceae archaeon]
MIENRKEEHINIAESRVVSPDHNFWDDIKFVHQAVPEIDFDRIDTAIKFLNLKTDFPILISSMTGGTERAREINRNLARAAEAFGIGMGVGSMRAAVEKRELSDTFSVINEYKIRYKIANIGAPQLIDQEKKGFDNKKIDYVFDLIGANFLAVHFNFLQEMVQPEGDHNSRGVMKRLQEVAASYPVIVKETGNGFSREAANMFRDAGVKAIDVGGLGGTSFAAIEYYRAEKAGDREKMDSGRTFWDWGIPSPASIRYCNVGLPVIGSGGLRNGLDLARSISMGSEMGGFARTLLSSADKSYEDVEREVKQIIRDLKIAMFLTSSGKVNDLRKAGKIIMEPLKSWLSLYGDE